VVEEELFGLVADLIDEVEIEVDEIL